MSDRNKADITGAYAEHDDGEAAGQEMHASAIDLVELCLIACAKAIPFVIAVWAIAVIWHFTGWAEDNLARPQFMARCTFGHLDDERLKACNKAYDRYRAVVANDWRPLSVKPE